MKRSVAVIAAATAIGQTLTLAAAPLLSRLYDPAHYGVFGTVVSLASILAAVMAIRIERAVALPPEDDDASVLLVVGVGAILLSLVTACVVFILASSLLEWPGIIGWAVPVLGSAMAANALFLQMAVRMRWYRGVALRNAGQPALAAAAQVVFGLVGWRPSGLVVGLVLGRLAGIGGIASKIQWRVLRDRNVFLSDAKRLTLRYRRVLALGSIAGLLNVAGLQMAVPLVAWGFGTPDAGQFAMAQLLVSAPLVLGGTAVGQVFLGEFAHLVRLNDPGARRLFVRASYLLAAIAVAVGAVVFAASQWAIPWVLGSNWDLAGQVARALTPVVVLRFIAAPLAHTLVVLEKQGTQILLDAARVTMVVAAVLAGWFMSWTIVQTVWIYSVAMAGVYALQWTLCRSALARSMA